jgi:hypothetical protein
VSVRALLPVLVGLLFLHACGGEDPNTRLYAAVDQICELRARCEPLWSSEPARHSLEACVEDTTLWLAAMHHVYGAGCIDAFLDQIDCRLLYDCDFSPTLSCPDGGVECELRYPCEEHLPAAEKACGGFVSSPDLGVGWDAL